MQEFCFLSIRAVALAAGIKVASAGKKINAQRIIYTLEQLQKDGFFPEEIHLAGDRDGTIDAIYAANKIY
jgi:DNA-binding PadR family transcriptional regulator